MNELIKKIEQWAIDREIHKKGTIEGYTEEFTNFCRNSLQLEFGDVLVTLIILAKQLDLNLTQCLEKA